MLEDLFKVVTARFNSEDGDKIKEETPAESSSNAPDAPHHAITMSLKEYVGMPLLRISRQNERRRPPCHNRRQRQLC